jgi:hypothetical protein
VLRATPKQPKYWKALIAVALFAVPIASLVHVAIPSIPVPFLAIVTILGTAFCAFGLNQRMADDSRTRYDMNLEIVEHTTRAAPHVDHDDRP